MDQAVDKQIIRDRSEVVFIDGSRPTPDLVIQYMLNATAPKYTDKALVLFDPCLALELRRVGVKNVVMYATTINDKMRPWFDSVGIEVTDSLETEMKFDVILANPPYKGVSALHQKFFNKAVDLLVDGGQMVFIQPASAYVNNKEAKKAPEVEMIEHVRQHSTFVKLMNGPDVFPDAEVFGKLSISKLVKDNKCSDTVDLLEYTDGSIYRDIYPEAINYFEFNPEIYISVADKVKNYINMNSGSFHDIMESDTSVEKFKLPMIRGHIGCDDMATAISIDPSFDSVECNHGIPVESNEQRKNVRTYLETYVARFCLAITKYNGNQHRGEFMTVPLVDFDRSWDDESLCELFGITKKEYKEILRVIPKFY